jgi:hypothetical protein
MPYKLKLAQTLSVLCTVFNYHLGKKNTYPGITLLFGRSWWIGNTRARKVGKCMLADMMHTQQCFWGLLEYFKIARVI